MKKINCKQMAILFSAMVINTICVACGSDESAGNNESIDNKESATNVSSDIKPFIGLWMIKTNQTSSKDFPYYKTFLFQDKKCRAELSYKYNSQEGKTDLYDNLDWIYDKSNKRLVIAGIANAQWEITATSDLSWTGLSLWAANQIGYVAHKDTTVNSIWDYLQSCTTWSCDDVYIDKRGYLEGVIIAGESHYYSQGTSEINILYYDVEQDVIRREVQNVRGGLQCRWHTIKEIYHPFSYNGMYMDVFVEYGEQGKVLGNYSGRFTPAWKKEK